jgi:putative inorganic carbon (HCO3(-)) transporter
VLFGIGCAAAFAWLPPAALAAGLAGVGSLAILAAPLLGLALAAFGVPFGSLVPLPLGAGALTVTPIALALAALGWTLAALARRRLPGIPRASRPLLWPLGVMLLCLAAATWMAPDLLEAVFDAARWLLLGLALVLAAALAARPRRLQALLLAVLAAGTAAALAGIFTTFRGDGPAAFAVAGGLYRAYGTFGQPNPFAGYMNMVWPIGAALALVAVVPLASGRRASDRGAAPAESPGGQGSVEVEEDRGIPGVLAAASLVAAGASGLALLLSWSRGGWLAAVVGAGVMGLVWLVAVLRDHRLRSRALALLWFALVAAGLLLVAGAVQVPQGIADRLASIGETFAVWDVGDAEVNDANFATIERVAHWEAAAAMWSERPWLGQGPGHYPIAYAAFQAPRWSDPLGHAHNIYLNFLAEAGLVGLAGYLLFFGAAFLCALRAALRPRTALEAALGLGLAGVLGALAFHSLLDNLYVHDLTVQLGLLLGLTVAAGQTAADGRTVEAGQSAVSGRSA